MNIRQFVWFAFAFWGLQMGTWAQSSLDEIGIGVGGGANLLVGEPTQVGYGFHTQAYYSHYFCGKRTGFHTVAGFRFLGSKFDRSFSATAPADLAQENSVKLGWVDLGFMGKIRRNEYHRSNEACLMAGPKINLNTLAIYADSAGSGGFHKVDAKSSFFNVGLQVSAQFRRKFDKTYWFIHPGAEYYFLPSISNSAAGSFQNLYLFLMFEVNLWDAKG